MMSGCRSLLALAPVSGVVGSSLVSKAEGVSGADSGIARDAGVISVSPMGRDNYDAGARVWNSVDNWCTLCTEPHNGWNEHRGKREHICLEMVYDLIVRTFRPWDSHSCVEGTTTRFGDLHGDSKRVQRWRKEAEGRAKARPTFKRSGQATRGGSGAERDRGRYRAFFEGVEDDLLYCCSSQDFPDAFRDTRQGEYEFNIFSVLRQHDRVQIQRRREIHAVMRYLFSKNLLFCGRKFSSSPFATMNVDFHGYLVLCKELFQPLINIFPKSDAKETSAMTQMISASFNLETLYDICDLRPFVPVSEMSAQGSMVDPTLGGDTVPGSLPDLTFQQKGSFVRGVFGQLRWAVEPEQVICPFPDGQVTIHDTIMCQFLLRLMVSELISLKLQEYVSRVEGIWRCRGMETIPPPAHIDPYEPVLPLTNRGMLAYYDNKLHHEDYKAMEALDPFKIRRRQIVFFADYNRAKKY